MLTEKGKERREEKKNRGKSEGDRGFERFSRCRGSSFFVRAIEGEDLDFWKWNLDVCYPSDFISTSASSTHA